MAKQSGRGHAVQILKPTTVNDFELNIDGCRTILLAENVRDKPVVVVSVAGAFRKGKSFLLGFFLRYLRNKGKDGWLGGENTPLEGFSWRGGSDRDTQGILLWDEVFLMKTPDGREVAVLLMDTQGAFDSESTLNECVLIFGLSMLMSSVQIYNISQNIQENDLEHLRLFIEYGRLAMKGTQKKPFQKLLFLVRDWQFKDQHPYGATGGKTLLEKWLCTDHKKTELKECRQHIRSCFSEIDCFLMPYPGEKAATEQKFNGQLSEIADKFKDNLIKLVPSVLAPANLLVKKVMDKTITCSQLLEYLQTCAQTFKNKVPRVESLLKATANFQNKEAADECLRIFKETMSELWEEDVLNLDMAEIQMDHDWVRTCVQKKFDLSPKVGDADVAKSFRDQLSLEINEAFQNLVLQKDRTAIKARASKTQLVNPISMGVLTPIPVIGPMILAGLAAGDLGARDSDTAEEKKKKERRQKKRTLLKQRLNC